MLQEQVTEEFLFEVLQLKMLHQKWRSLQGSSEKVTGLSQAVWRKSWSHLRHGQISDQENSMTVTAGKTHVTKLQRKTAPRTKTLKYWGWSGERTVCTTQKHTALSESHHRSILLLNLCFSLASEMLLCCVGSDVCWIISNNQTQLLQFWTLSQHRTSYYP